MGTWNGTCGISQMPIHEGDDVVMIFLENDEYMETGTGGFTYSDSLYKPISLPIKGKYNGVGMIEPIRKNNSIMAFNEVDNYFNGIVNYFNEYVFRNRFTGKMDLNINPQELEIKTIEELVDKVYWGNLLGIGYELIHLEVYDSLIEEIGLRLIYDYEKGEYVTQRDMYHHLLKTIVENTRASIGVGNEVIDNVMKGRLDYYKNRDNLKTVQEDFLELWLLINSKEATRKLWSPQCGAGSGNDEHYMQKLIAEFIIKRDRKLHEEYERDNTNYEDMKDEIGKQL